MNKRGQDLLTGNAMFIILTALFAGLLLFFLFRVGSGAGINEQTYAKKIALSIDSLRSGTEMTIDISELYYFADKNNFDYSKNNVVEFNLYNSTITVRVIDGEGYSFNYFNKIEPGNVIIDSAKKELKIKV